MVLISRPMIGWPRPRFLNLSTSEILGQVILCCRECLVHYGMFNSIPDICPLDARRIFPFPWSWQSTMSPNIAKCLMLGQNHPQLKTSGLEISFSCSYYAWWPKCPSFRRHNYIALAQGKDLDNFLDGFDSQLFHSLAVWPWSNYKIISVVIKCVCINFQPECTEGTRISNRFWRIQYWAKIIPTLIS